MTRTLVLFLSLLASFSLFAQPTVTLEAPMSIDAENRITWRVVITAAEPISDATLIFSSGGNGIVSAPSTCDTNFRDRSDCRIDLAAGATQELAFVVQAYARYGHASGYVSLSKYGIERNEEAIFAHEFPVTNTNDSGLGSLRQALLDIQRDCVRLAEPCAPVFRIAGDLPAEGWYTIAVQSPLPPVVGDVYIDGRTQSRFTADTNPSGGPEIYLDGSAAGSGHGLDVYGSLRVDDIAIGNFPGNGIYVHESSGLRVKRCWLGVDPTGVHVAPNGLRGVQSDMAGNLIIEQSVLSGNRRAGAFVIGSAFGWITVNDNLVGIAADRVTPLGNGASGLFFDKQSVGWGRAHAFNNRIANNVEAGISLSRRAAVDVATNDFGPNGGLAIDVALDGPTNDTTPGLPGQGGILGRPRLITAKAVDGKTTITGTFAARPTSTYVAQRVVIYADGVVVAELSQFFTNNTFTVTIDRDLHGQSIRASEYTTFIYNWDDPAPATSELSEALVVEE